MAKQAIGAGTLLAPLPVVLIGTCGEVAREQGTTVIQNPMTAAWAGVINSEPAMLSVSVRPSRLTHQFLMETGEFTVNVMAAKHAALVDFCGVKSGRDLDKVAALKLTTRPVGLSVTAGYEESAVILACTVQEVKKLGSHDLFLARIVDVFADSDLFDGQKLDLTRTDLLSYAHGDYYGGGQRIGFFGYSAAKQNVLKRRLPREHWPKRSPLVL